MAVEAEVLGMAVVVGNERCQDSLTVHNTWGMADDNLGLSVAHPMRASRDRAICRSGLIVPCRHQKEFCLLRLGARTADITHEALATQWHLDRQWVSNAPGHPRGDDLRTLQSLIADAAGWAQAEGKRSGEHLARGHDLSLYDSLAARRPSWITHERAFIDASRHAAWWSVIWRRSAVAGLILLFLVASAVAYVAEQQRRLAEERKQEAEQSLA
jgi:hypothetical protein